MIKALYREFQILVRSTRKMISFKNVIPNKHSNHRVQFLLIVGFIYEYVNVNTPTYCLPIDKFEIRKFSTCFFISIQFTNLNIITKTFGHWHFKPFSASFQFQISFLSHTFLSLFCWISVVVRKRQRNLLNLLTH